MSDEQSLSQVLRDVRGARTQTIEDLCRQTGLSANVVRGLEAGRFDVVEPIYLRLALQVLGPHLGLDSRDLVARLDRELGVEAASPAAVPASPRMRPASASDGTSARTLVMVVVVLAVLLGLVALFWSLSEPDTEPVPRTGSGAAPTPAAQARAPGRDAGPLAPTAAATDRRPAPPDSARTGALPASSAPAGPPLPGADGGIVAPTPTAQPPAGQAPASQLPGTPTSAGPLPAGQTPAGLAAGHTPPSDAVPAGGVPVPPAVASGSVQLSMEAVDSTWVQVLADDRLVFQGVMLRGERRAWEAREQVFVYSGRANGIRYSIQGKPLPPALLGIPARALRFRATAREVLLLDPELNPVGAPLLLTADQP